MDSSVFDALHFCSFVRVLLLYIYEIVIFIIDDTTSREMYPTMQRITINRTQHNHVIDSGGSGEVIVLLHGFLSSANYWSKLRPLLVRIGYRVVAIDLLGFGRAPKPIQSQYDYADHITHIEATLQRLHIKKPFVMVGHSMGALIAARYSRVHADALRSLILLHPPLYKDTLQTRTTLRNTSKLYRFLLDSPYRRIGWLILRVVRLELMSGHSHASREKSLAHVIEVAEIAHDLKNSVVPTLLVVGVKDRKEYADNLTEFEMSPLVSVTLEDVNHHSPRLQPMLVRDRIIDFIQ